MENLFYLYFVYGTRDGIVAAFAMDSLCFYIKIDFTREFCFQFGEDTYIIKCPKEVMVSKLGYLNLTKIYPSNCWSTVGHILIEALSLRSEL